jgi:hypothetical protein
VAGLAMTSTFPFQYGNGISKKLLFRLNISDHMKWRHLSDQDLADPMRWEDAAPADAGM